MAINFSDELAKYNERLSEELETNKEDNSLDVSSKEAVEEVKDDNSFEVNSPEPTETKDSNPINIADSETDYKEKLAVDNLQTNIDVQSLIDGERDIDANAEGTQTLIKVDNPKDGNELPVNIAGASAEKDETKTFSNEIETYNQKISTENTETEADEENVETESEVVGILNPKDSLEDSKDYSDTVDEYKTKLSAENLKVDDNIQSLVDDDLSAGAAARESLNLDHPKTQEQSFETANPESNRSLDTQGADGDNYNAIYQPVGAEFSDVGKIIQRSLGFNGSGEDNYKRIEGNLLDDEINVFDPLSKEENSLTSRDLTFFLYNNIPYVIGRTASLIGGVVDSVQSVADNPENFLSQWGTVRQALDTMHQISYYSPDEAVQSLGQTFITLQLLPFMKGISVKYKRMSLDGGLAEKFEDTFLNVDKNFDSPETPFKDLKEWFDNTFRAISSGIKSLFGSTEYEIPDNETYLATVRDKILTLRLEYDKAISQQIKDVFDNKYEHYQKGDGKITQRSSYNAPFNSSETEGISSTLPLNNDDLKNNDPYSKSIIDIIKGRDLTDYEVAFKVNSGTYYDNEGNPDKEKTDEVYNNTKNSLSEHLEIADENKEANIYEIIRNQDINTLIKNIVSSERVKNIGTGATTEHQPIWDENATKNTRNSLKGFIDLSREQDKRIANIYETIKNEKVDEKYIGIIRNFKTIHSIGYIMVYPTLTDGGAGTAFKIPFQFNPTIQESGHKVKYESQNLLHRQGNIYSYVGTEGQTLSIETTYMMTTDGKDDANRTRGVNELGGEVTWSVENGPQDAWYSAWSPKVIQSIESALRSIALPQMSGGGETDIKFHRPPMIKIVFGQHGADPKSFDKDNLYPMLTYPVNSGDNVKFYHRTYLVTSVNIVKDTNESPLHLNEAGDLIDTHSFKAQIELNEVDSNYVGIMPDFGDYYESYKAEANSYVEAVEA